MRIKNDFFFLLELKLEEKYLTDCVKIGKPWTRIISTVCGVRDENIFVHPFQTLKKENENFLVFKQCQIVVKRNEFEDILNELNGIYVKRIDFGCIFNAVC